MNKYHLVILVLLLTINSYACEICGCSHSSFQIGLLPNFNKGFVGYRYTFSTFTSHVRDEPSEFSKDNFQSMEVWGGYNFNKLQVMAFLPYLISRKESDDGITRSSGVGDAMILINYKLLSSTNLSSNENTTVRHELFAGGGIKFPTGINRVNPDDPEFNIGDFNSQSGTGSFDYLINATYNFLWDNSGIVTNASYRINSSNKQDYRFGNRSYLNTSYYYTISQASIKFKPNVGLNYQVNSINSFIGKEVESSNGYNLNSTIGINVLRGKLGFNAMAFIPISQNTYDGQTKMKWRALFGFTFSI